MPPTQLKWQSTEQPRLASLPSIVVLGRRYNNGVLRVLGRVGCGQISPSACLRTLFPGLLACRIAMST
jgi:hypothetical protein